MSTGKRYDVDKNNLIDIVEVFDPSEFTTGTSQLLGPGSQVDEDPGVLDYINMPSDMNTYQQPQLPEPDEIQNIAGAMECFKLAIEAMNQCSDSELTARIPLTGLGNDCLNLVNQVLGVGEVSITIEHKNSQTMIQESVMAGLWRVHELNEEGKVCNDYIEVSLIPDIVRIMAFKGAQSQVDKSPIGLPQGTINSPSILVELSDVANQWRSPDSAHVVNLSLLPVSEADIYALGERLGVGPVTILSRGYGNCRIGSTNCKNVWWIKYYNSEDSLILNSLEVVDIPEVALASKEDIADSAIRLQEILDIYQ